ncbi:copper chaperone [Cryptotrichosporon argae]
MLLASHSFKTDFAVDMTCQNCVDAVRNALRDVPGIERYDIELDKKRVTITGKAPPSHLLSALKSTRRQVLVRGASSADPSLSSAAAISLLESPLPVPPSIATTRHAELAALPGQAARPLPLPGLAADEFSQKVFGICRFVQIAPTTILMDLTVRLPRPAAVGLSSAGASSATEASGSGSGSGHGQASARPAFNVYVASTGDMTDPPRSTGSPLVPLGRVDTDADGYGDLFKEVEGELWQWVGRACVVEAVDVPPPSLAAQPQTQPQSQSTSTIGRIFAGVVARSSGLWGNDKTVCACSGRTMWEEGRDMEQRSML